MAAMTLKIYCNAYVYMVRNTSMIVKYLLLGYLARQLVFMLCHAAYN